MLEGGQWFDVCGEMVLIKGEAELGAEEIVRARCCGVEGDPLWYDRGYFRASM